MTVEIDLQDRMHFVAVGEDGVAIHLDSSNEHGGEGNGFRPMELLLAGLGGCTAMDVLSILRKKRQKVTGYRVEVSGRQREEYPRVFTHIAIKHVITGQDVSDEAVRRAIDLSEGKYCPAYAMLKDAAEITTDFEIRPIARD
ncbi:MAG TPA: OsmC family protein [Chloroflexota bacterium]|nr:OsmC family protein [Chloroflexota bacterium]